MREERFEMDNIKTLVEPLLAVTLPILLKTLSPLLSVTTMILGIVYMTYKIRNEQIMYKRNNRKDEDNKES